MVVSVVSVEGDNNNMSSIPSGIGDTLILLDQFLDKIASTESGGSTLNGVHHEDTGGGFSVV